MDDGPMDTDATGPNGRRNSGQSSPRTTKSLPASTTQRSARATSVEMADATNQSGSSETDTSNDSSATSMDAANQTDLPSIDEQVFTVLQIMGEDLKDGMTGYVISEHWLERVWARTTENNGRQQDFSKEALEGPIGPVDNSGLIDEEALQDDLAFENGEDFIPLVKGKTIQQDFEVFPAKAWEMVIRWYGLKPGTPVVRRYAHNTAPKDASRHVQWELYPPVITIRKLSKAQSTITQTSKKAEKIVTSRHGPLAGFFADAKKAAGINQNTKIRAWRKLKIIAAESTQPTQPSGILTPDASPRGNSPVTSQQIPLIMDIESFKALPDGVERENITSGKHQNALTLDDVGLTEDSIVILEEPAEDGEFISETLAASTKSKGSSKPGQGNSGKSTPTSGPLTRGRTRTGRVRGHVGLTNLGNTCYMNSALQCLRSVEELSMYFLNKKWQEEVNTSNPIGHKGAIAKVYASLLTTIYDVSSVSSFAPRNFKQALGKANSLFSGYGQQDSQEFVSWLVDALHEDLNRVHEKPYRENPDSEDNTHESNEAIKALGETYRANHRARNDSVSMDLFSGFYKNTMVCPVCEKVSITFDPYSQLTLQLPIEQTWTHKVTYVPLHGKPFHIEVDIDKNATIKQLKEYVGKRGGGVEASHIMASEVYSHKFYRHLDDKSTIAETNIAARDDIFFYELDHAPTNWPPPKRKGSRYKSYSLLHNSSDEDIPENASPLHDRIVIPVFHRGPSVSSYRSQANTMALWPFHIVLTREEAKDYDSILRKLLAKVAQATTRPIFNDVVGATSESRSNSDVVLTTEDDASPNDPRVKDGSIEGEDLVEVTMTDVTDVTDVTNVPTHSETSDEVPEVLRPGSYIPPEFKELFEIKHSRKSNEIVTTGWSTVDQSKGFESITKRIRIPPPREESVRSSTTGSDEVSSDEDDDIPPNPNHEAALDAANESSDEEMQSFAPDTQDFSRGGRNNKKKNKKQRRQERRQEQRLKNKRAHKSARIAPQPVYADDLGDESDESLVRMGEALVLDWKPKAFDILFGGDGSDERGMHAMKSITTFEDQEIIDKRNRKALRKKNGITLEECFTESSKSEVLSEDNAWYCNRCKELRRATKTLEIWTVPDILIIHLKRFSGFRSFRDKIEELVDFPVEGLNLTGKVGHDEGKDLTYDLFAVDNHYGGLGGGHYTATARNFFDEQWYDYNDSIVSRCESGQKAVSKAAYLLFYRRRTPVPLGPPSLQEIVTANNSQSSEEDDDDDEQNTRSGPGKGSRLGDLSRNGSSKAGAAAAGAGVLAGAGSQLSAAVSHQRSGAAAESPSDDETLPPAYNEVDEGYHDANEYGPNYSYGPSVMYNDATWGFNNLNNRDLDDAASDAPNLGSDGGADLENRMVEDFGDELIGTHPGVSTPADDEVAEIRLRAE